MAAVAVGACQQCASLNVGIVRLPVSRNVVVGRVSLAADPLLLRSGLKFSPLNFRKIGKRRIAPWRASAGDDIEEEKVEKEGVETERGFIIRFRENLKDSMSSAIKPAVTVFLAGILLLQPVDDAMAAGSGGRMGGRVFKSAPAPSRSYSGGGGGGGGARVYNAPPIYGSPYGYGSPFGFSPFTPFFGGGYYGGGLVQGPAIGFGGGGLFFFALIAFVTLRAVAGFFRDRFGDSDDFDD